MSRLPLPVSPDEIPLPGETLLLLESLRSAPVNDKDIKSFIGKDPVLSRVRQFVLHGWPSKVDSSFLPFWRIREELSIQDGCILRGSRVVIPGAIADRVIEMLHEGHPGVSRLKGLARSFVWWPHMDAHLEESLSTVPAHQACSSSIPFTPLGMATTTLVTPARRLCRPISWEDVPHCSGCTF